MTGDRVAVGERRIALASRSVEEVGPEGDPAAGELELQSAPGHVNAHDDASLAVADAEPDVVLADQDVVADGEAASAELELVGAERARCAHPLTRSRVEVGDVDAAEGIITDADGSTSAHQSEARRLRAASSSGSTTSRSWAR